jgi:excisionase family DNA binding protein
MSSQPKMAPVQLAPVSPWLTAKEAAQYLKVSPRTIVEWARSGKVIGHTLSGFERHVWRFRIDELDAILCSPAVPEKERAN